MVAKHSPAKIPGTFLRLRCANEVQVELHKRLQKATYNIATNDIFAFRFARATKVFIFYFETLSTNMCIVKSKF